MKIRIEQAQIVDSRHSDNGKKRDILIEDGKIVEIAENIDSEADETVVCESLCVSIGWMDLRANFRDPGEEHKEDLLSGLKAAKNGGFTAVALSPDTNPAVDHKGAIEYLLNRARGKGVEVVPVGAISKGLKGESLSEMYDMHLAGARAFGDAKKPVTESGLLQRALLYASNFDSLVFHFPYDSGLVQHGQMNEGSQSTLLGLKGIPAIAEEMFVHRDLTLLEYTGGKLHLGPLSTRKSIELVEEAKKKGLNVSSEVSVSHLAYSDRVLEDFDTNFKLMPPLRTEENRRLLIEALLSGKIDVISSDHSPEDEENKKLEFDYAAFGISSIEIFFPLLYSNIGENLTISDLVASFSINPRKILGMKIPEIQVGEKANLTLFSLAGETEIQRKSFSSKGYNLPEQGNRLKGKVLRTIYEGI